MLNDLQAHLLKMLKWFHNYCCEHELKYYVIGGTMLGAVRHSGFIPWDDDVDVIMPRSDYEKIIKLLENPEDDYIVESPKSEDEEYLYGFAKLYDLRTSMTETLKKPITRGVYIDIFPLDGIGNTLEESYRNYKKIDRANMLLAMKTSAYRKGRVWWKNVAVFVGSLIPVNAKKLAKHLDSLCSKHSFDEYEFCGNLVSTYRVREIIRKDVFGEPTLYDFEDTQVFGPEKYEEYLTNLFRNWRELPPEKKRCSAHDFANLDLNKPYRGERT